MGKLIVVINMTLDGFCDHVDDLAKGKKMEKILRATE